MNETAITLRQAWQYGGPLMWVLAALSVLAFAKILVLLIAHRRGALTLVWKRRDGYGSEKSANRL